MGAFSLCSTDRFCTSGGILIHSGVCCVILFSILSEVKPVVGCGCCDKLFDEMYERSGCFTESFTCLFVVLPLKAFSTPATETHQKFQYSKNSKYGKDSGQDFLLLIKNCSVTGIPKIHSF